MRDDVTAAAKILSGGGTILYPTDTVWGIGCDATSKDAVQKVYQIKQRADQKSMLILLDDFRKLPDYIAEVPEMAEDLILLTDKPLTIIYPGGINLAGNVLASDGSVGIRIVRDDFCVALIRKFGKPIVSTSANISDHPSPVNFNEIDPNIIGQVNFVVRWRQNDTKKGKPSGIIKLGIHGEIKVIRE
jgi:L-threonylcarbamoyladenylate synthase